MLRTLVLAICFLALTGCQGSGTPQTTAERCSTLDMEIAATEENVNLQAGTKVEMIEGLAQQKAELNCP